MNVQVKNIQKSVHNCVPYFLKYSKIILKEKTAFFLKNSNWESWVFSIIDHFAFGCQSLSLEIQFSLALAQWFRLKKALLFCRNKIQNFHSNSMHWTSFRKWSFFGLVRINTWKNKYTILSEIIS